MCEREGGGACNRPGQGLVVLLIFWSNVKWKYSERAEAGSRLHEPPIHVPILV